MQIYDILKPFNTVNRRLKIGGDISSDDTIDPWPSFDERVNSGFLKPRDDLKVEQASITPAPPMNLLGGAATAPTSALAPADNK